MQKLVLVAMSVFAGFIIACVVLGAVLHLQPARAGAPTGALGTGDTNGDGFVDISDAVYTLLYLFKDGPAPVACADSPEIVARVAALEATNERIALSLEEIAHPCRERADRFVDNANGTVTDTCTGLMWQQISADANGDGRGDAMSWDQAFQYVDQLELAGHANWRLPTVKELEFLVAYSPWSPAADPIFHVELYGHWTATRDVSSPGRVWYVNFNNKPNNTPNGQVLTAHLHSTFETSVGQMVLAVRGE